MEQRDALVRDTKNKLAQVEERYQLRQSQLEDAFLRDLAAGIAWYNGPRRSPSP